MTPKELEKVKEILEFYANEENYEDGECIEMSYPDVLFDKGKRAEEALSIIKAGEDRQVTKEAGVDRLTERPERFNTACPGELVTAHELGTKWEAYALKLEPIINNLEKDVRIQTVMELRSENKRLEAGVDRLVEAIVILMFSIEATRQSFFKNEQAIHDALKTFGIDLLKLPEYGGLYTEDQIKGILSAMRKGE